MAVLRTKGQRLIREFDNEILCIEPWGNNSFRIRCSRLNCFQEEDWALLPSSSGHADIVIDGQKAVITNGKLRAELLPKGKVTFYNQKDEVLLEEYFRNRSDIHDFCSALDINAREFSPHLGGDFKLTVRFESNPHEKLYGMGQYQQSFLDLKGCTLELAHRNSQSSVPFLMSNLGYGFLWNNPAIGDVTFGKNITKWESKSTKQLDYWITAGDTPGEIEESYAKVTGTVPMMPDYAMGFWQCKLRYRTQNELLEVAREYKRRNLPISIIVIDFFHWPNQGTWMFDKEYWPDPEGMVRELKDMGIELMVSIWPTVSQETENYREMLEKGYLVHTERGVRTTMQCFGDTVFYDATNPDARKFVWSKAKENYYDKGICIFWLDEAEPEYSVYDFDNYRYYLGSNLQVGNIYPVLYAKTFYDGMMEAGQKNIINLVRCAWAGSQKYGALIWSGDIDSSFASLRNQFVAGLNMGIAGIPWWTTDIGGFHGGNSDDPKFRECILRWFEYAVFCPVFRLHGDREPHFLPVGNSGGGLCGSGGPNEIWSYGEEAYVIFKEYLLMRERLHPYITKQMEAAHEKGTPVIRPLFYEFPDDKLCWEIEDQYMFGPDILVAPILYENQRSRKVYLPSRSAWKDARNGKEYIGGITIEYDAPIAVIPVFIRDGALIEIY